MKLNELKDNDGARQNPTRKGRGIGSGKGKTAGRGHKGQSSRSGVAINGFEGGQTPIYMRVPKRGFTKPNQKLVETINLAKIEEFVSAKKLKAKIDRAALEEAGLIRKTGSLVKILGKGEIKSKVEITADEASKSAIEAIEKAGGKVTLPAKKEAAKKSA